MAGEDLDSKGWGDVLGFDDVPGAYSDGESFDPDAVHRLMDPARSPLTKGPEGASEMWLRAAGCGGLTLDDSLSDSRFGIFGPDQNT